MLPSTLLRPLLLAGLSLALFSCADPEPVEDEPLTQAGPVAVTVQTLQATSWHGTIDTFGVVEALEEVNVAAELSGTVRAVHVNEGDRISAGQLLLELDPRKRQLALDQASQQVQRAKAALEETRSKLKRRRNLAEKETISEEVLDNAQLAVDAASAAYQQALASKNLAARELEDTQIYSPTDGLVDVQAVEAGEPVQAGASLITLQAVHGLRVHTWVSEADIGRIRATAQARVSTPGLPGREFAASVEWVGVNADSATGNFPVKLILTDAPAALRPGMTATVALDSVVVEDALLLPEAALVDRARRRVVFVVEQGRALMREPLLAAGFSDRLLVLDGLAAGEQVIVSGQSALIEGTPVIARSGD